MLAEKDSLKPIEIGFLEADEMLNYIGTVHERFYGNLYLAIETIQNLGQVVGKSVFDTCILVGRLYEHALVCGTFKDIQFIYRKEEKLNLCGTLRSKDKDIIQALVRRFAPNEPNFGKGTKKNPGWFFGFKADIWQACAVTTTYHDLYLDKQRKGG